MTGPPRDLNQWYSDDSCAFPMSATTGSAFGIWVGDSDNLSGVAWSPGRDSDLDFDFPAPRQPEGQDRHLSHAPTAGGLTRKCPTCSQDTLVVVVEGDGDDDGDMSFYSRGPADDDNHHNESPASSLEENRRPHTPPGPASQHRLHRCAVLGCTARPFADARGLARHRDCVHALPVTLACGAVRKNRPDNILRHAKRCSTCRDADAGSLSTPSPAPAAAATSTRTASRGASRRRLSLGARLQS